VLNSSVPRHLTIADVDTSDERATGIEPAEASMHRRNEVGALLLVSPHQRMSFYLETRRLIMRPWVQSDSEGYRAGRRTGPRHADGHRHPREHRLPALDAATATGRPR
jgi:hypothetical protein